MRQARSAAELKERICLRVEDWHPNQPVKVFLALAHDLGIPALGVQGRMEATAEEQFVTDVERGYALYLANCARCHASSAATPQAPFFAGNDVDAAYAAVKAQVNLDTPSASRLVVRLRDEFHNCWTDCGTAATEMLNRVTAFQRGIPLS